ncbi:MAG: hypothetical protein ACE5KM_04145, partial [Planctomycetaceae bacterium]
MMDGSVHVITRETSTETLRRMIQHNDGKQIDFPRRHRGRSSRGIAVEPVPESVDPSPDDAAESPPAIDGRKKR